MADGESDTAIVNKKDIVGKKLQEREDERVKEIHKRKEESDKTASKTEKTDVFMETLTAGVGIIKEGLANASDQDKSTLAVYFDTLSSNLADIQKYVNDSAMFLSSYDLAQKQQQLNDLQGEIALSRGRLLPKSKFAFKNRRKQTTASPEPTTIPTQSSAASTANMSLANMSANEYRVSAMSNQVIKITAENVANKDVVISSVSGCTIHMTGSPSAMHLTNLTDSTILAGPCGRSIFIEKCSNCVLVLACQQLRIHEAVDCTFFIHVTSKAIIEDSKDLKFGPYELTYNGMNEHYKESGLNCLINNWYDVDDFNWLVKDKQSPNWMILPKDERKSHQIE